MKLDFQHPSETCVRIIVLMVSLFLMSCEETIDLDLDQVEERIVIEGIVSDKPSVSSVRLSFTQSIYVKSAPKRTSGAVVTLSDDAGNSEVLQEVQPGLYAQTTMNGTIQREYRLKVAFEGVEYSAVSRMPDAMTLDSVRASVSGTDPRYSRPVTMRYYLTNKPGVEEFCIIKTFTQNGGESSWMLFSDKYTDGTQAVLEGSSFYASGTFVRVEVLSIDKATYEYLRTLEEIAGKGGFDVPDLLRMNDYNPRSNLTNGALGYFSAQSQRDYVVNLR